MKTKIKNLLQQFKLLELARRIAYYLFGYDAESFRQKGKMIQFYNQFIKKEDLCFDIGANIGNRTDIFLNLGAKVICVEPQSTCLQELYRKFGKNRNVTIVAKGVAEREGFADLAVCENASVLSTMSDTWKNQSRFSETNKWSRTEKITLTNLDLLIKEYGKPVFCKIDVEGFEEQVLRGLTKPIPVISFEFAKEVSHETKNCVDCLLSIGQYKFNFSSGESMELLFPTWVTPDELFEKLDSINDQLLWGDIYAKHWDD